MAPAIDTKEALVVMADHINDSFMNNCPAMTSGEVGHRVTRMLEMADQSARRARPRPQSLIAND